jgi:hypothetical protein
MKRTTIYLTDSFRTQEIKNAEKVYFVEGKYIITTTKN